MNNCAPTAVAEAVASSRTQPTGPQHLAGQQAAQAGHDPVEEGASLGARAADADVADAAAVLPLRDDFRVAARAQAQDAAYELLNQWGTNILASGPAAGSSLY